MAAVTLSLADGATGGPPHLHAEEHRPLGRPTSTPKGWPETRKSRAAAGTLRPPRPASASTC